MCIWKHISAELAWDEVVHLACTAYNFVPNEHSNESAFSLCLGEISVAVEPKTEICRWW